MDHPRCCTRAGYGPLCIELSLLDGSARQWVRLPETQAISRYEDYGKMRVRLVKFHARLLLKALRPVGNLTPHTKSVIVWLLDAGWSSGSSSGS